MDDDVSSITNGFYNLVQSLTLVSSIPTPIDSLASLEKVPHTGMRQLNICDGFHFVFDYFATRRVWSNSSPMIGHGVPSEDNNINIFLARVNRLGPARCVKSAGGADLLLQFANITFQIAPFAFFPLLQLYECKLSHRGRQDV